MKYRLEVVHALSGRLIPRSYITRLHYRLFLFQKNLDFFFSVAETLLPFPCQVDLSLWTFYCQLQISGYNYPLKSTRNITEDICSGNTFALLSSLYFHGMKKELRDMKSHSFPNLNITFPGVLYFYVTTSSCLTRSKPRCIE